MAMTTYTGDDAMLGLFFTLGAGDPLPSLFPGKAIAVFIDGERFGGFKGLAHAAWFLMKQAKAGRIELVEVDEDGFAKGEKAAAAA